MGGALLVSILMLIACAFFSGVEIAYFSANKFKIELKNNQGDFIAGILSKFLKNTPQFITTILIGNNVALVLYSLSSSILIDEFFLSWFGINLAENQLNQIIIQTCLSTLVVLILSEYIPKIIFRSNPNFMLALTALPMQLFIFLFTPLFKLLNYFNKFILYPLLRIKSGEKKYDFSKKDLHLFLQERLFGNSFEDDIKPEIINNALDFNKMKSRDFMVPRTEIIAISIDASIEDLQKMFVETEHSRLLVYHEHLDNVRGYVHLIELYSNPKTIESIMQQILVVPESMPAHILLREFSVKRKSVALVVDEFGGTAGLVTQEDLFEVIFGDIHDEHDEDENLVEKKVNEHEFLLSARLDIEYLNKKYNLDLPEGEFSTLGGMVMHYTENIPRPGDNIQIENFFIKIEKSSDNKIEEIKLIKP